MISLDAILPLFSHYYDVVTPVASPFDARADFKSHNEQYVLVKAAHIADIDSNEHIFFKQCGELTENELLRYHETAWEQGQSMITPYYGHKNTDISLMILAEGISDEASGRVPRLRHSAVYKLGLYGYSNYRLVVVDTKSGHIYCNRNGRTLKSVVKNIVDKHCMIRKSEDEKV